LTGNDSVTKITATITNISAGDTVYFGAAINSVSCPTTSGGYKTVLTTTNGSTLASVAFDGNPIVRSTLPVPQSFYAIGCVYNSDGMLAKSSNVATITLQKKPNSTKY